MNLSLLHLSDLHFSETSLGEQGHLQFLQRVQRTLDSLRVDLVVVSGDLTAKGTARELRDAKNWLTGLVRSEADYQLGLDLKKRAIPFVVAPGNWDVKHGLFERYFPDARTAPPSPFPVTSLQAGQTKINVVTIDTCIDGDLPASFEGNFQAERVRDLALDAGHFNIVVLHHSPMPTDEKAIRHHLKLLAWLSIHPIHLVLCGHTHRHFYDGVRFGQLGRFLRGDGRKMRWAKVKQLIGLRNSKLSSHPDLLDKFRRSSRGTRVSLDDFMTLLQLEKIGLVGLQQPVTFDKPRSFSAYIADLRERHLTVPATDPNRRAGFSMTPGFLDDRGEPGFALIEIDAYPDTATKALDWRTTFRDYRIRPAKVQEHRAIAVTPNETESHRRALNDWSELVNIGHNASHLAALADAYAARSLIPFLGAGVSCGAGLPGWVDFLVGLSRHKEEEVRLLCRNGQFEDAAELLIDSTHGIGETAFAQVLQATFDPPELPGSLHLGACVDIPQFFRGPIITTNFDTLIERAFARANVAIETFFATQAPQDALKAIIAARCCLFKVHGDARQRQGRILKKQDYLDAYCLPNGKIDVGKDIPQLFEAVVRSKSLLFLGCSLSADRTMQLLRHFRAAGTPTATHFGLLSDPGTESARTARTRELGEYGVVPLWFPTGDYRWLSRLVRGLGSYSAAQILQMSRESRAN